MSKLPEHTAPAEIYYDKIESEKYTRNSRITKIQKEIAERVYELLDVENEKSIFLDLGCGSGLSGQILNEKGHFWIGLDISADMLNLIPIDSNCIGSIRSDIGETLPFKSDAFDYVISVSAVQWLFHSFKKEHEPILRIKQFFRSLYDITYKKAILQFYCSKKEKEILKKEALKSGFYGDLIIDKEGTKNEKTFLLLSKTRINKRLDFNREDYSRKQKRRQK